MEQARPDVGSLPGDPILLQFLVICVIPTAKMTFCGAPKEGDIPMKFQGLISLEKRPKQREAGD